MGTAWAVPVEAVRQAVDMDGAIKLGQLAAAYAQYNTTAMVELGPRGFTATLIYTLPGHPDQVRHAVLCLTWTPLENRYRPPTPVRPGLGPLADCDGGAA